MGEPEGCLAASAVVRGRPVNSRSAPLIRPSVRLPETSLEAGPLLQFRALLAYYRRLRRLLDYAGRGLIRLPAISGESRFSNRT
jgi:hypothetical protein